MLALARWYSPATNWKVARSVSGLSVPLNSLNSTVCSLVVFTAWYRVSRATRDALLAPASHLQLYPQDEGVSCLALGSVEAEAGLVSVGADGAVEPARGAAPAHQLAVALRHVVLGEPRPAVRALRMAFGALGAERPPAPVADEPAFPRKAPPAPVADPRQLRCARRAQGQAALDGEQALPLHAPAA